ncbi:MoaD/ThiS family protein [Compostibacter hankyongensis]
MNIKLFGITREIIGEEQLTITDKNIRTVAELKTWLFSAYPSIRQLSSLAVAVNHTYAEDADPVGPDHEIALIPPVSGG